MRKTQLQLATALAVLAPSTLLAAPPRTTTFLNPTVEVLTEFQVTNPAPQNGSFGVDVVLEGDTAFVGSPSFSGQSEVYVYGRLSSGWVEQQVITPPDAPAFFGVQLSASGDRLAVLGLDAFFPPLDRGGVYVYQRQSGGQWQLEQKLVLSSTTTTFTTVTLDGTTIAAGVNDESVLVFELVSGQWQQTQRLVASDGSPGFGGVSTELSGGTLVVGALDFATGTGAGFIFEKASGVFQETQKLVPTSTGAFGLGSAIDGRDLAIGDFDNESVSIYRRRRGQWRQTQIITPPNGASVDDFGFAVDIDDGTMVVGARGQADGGAAYIYRRVRRQWVLDLVIQPSDLAPGDFFANTVSIDGTSLFVGAQGKDAFTGAAYAYQLFVPGEPSLIGASLGNDDFGGLGACSAQTSIDGLPVVFDRQVAPLTLDVSDFVIVTASGARVQPDCVSFFPSVNFDEGQTILTQGQFGGTGDTPIAVEIVGSIRSVDRTVNYRGQSISVTPFDTGGVLTYARELPVQRLGQFDQCPVGTGQIIQLAFASNVGANLAGTFPLTADFLGSFTVELADGTVVSPFNFGDTTADNYVELCLVATSPAIAVNVAPQTITNAGGILNSVPLRAIVQRF